MVLFFVAASITSPAKANGVPKPPANRDAAGPLWSLQPVTRPAVPDGPETNPIDRFLNAGFKSRRLKATGPADKSTLLRRVHLDLTGIPPTPAELDAFLADTALDAFEKTVDRLLADGQHAVRYARHWLDVLRYADADERMTAAPGIYLWRDWVINALNEDLPYDQFVQIQLTGRRTSERTQMSATGYRSRRDPRPGDEFALGFLSRGTGEHQQDLAINAADTVSTAFMGMTVGCAKCHDHMSDPISQQDFYALKALFDPLVLRKITLASAADLLANNKAQTEAERRRAPAEKALNDYAAPFRAKLRGDRILMLPPEAQDIIRKPERERSPAEQKIADDYFPILRIDDDKLTGSMTDAERRKYQDLQRGLNAVNDDANSRRPPPLPVFYTVETDPLRATEKSYVLTSGDPLRPELNREAKPGWPFAGAEPDFRDGRIEAFADWLTAPENPLFARVAVNRLWQWHFGEGLQKNPSDFGRLSGQPANPALLDWLASEFVRLGYSMKAMHRLMVTSDAYRRASEAGAGFEESQRTDPGNETLWHFRLQRLQAEPIWDSMQSAAGKLDLQIGGPSYDVRGGRGGDGGRNRSRGGDAPRGGDNRASEPRRRGAYIVRGYSASRDVTPNFLQSFDVDDGRAPCPLRTQTVTAPQALFLMNSPDIDRACGALADRLGSESKDGLPGAVDLAYRIAFSRQPSAEEKSGALGFLENDATRLKSFAWLLFNLDEFIYVR